MYAMERGLGDKEDEEMTTATTTALSAVASASHPTLEDSFSHTATLKGLPFTVEEELNEQMVLEMDEGMTVLH